MIHIHAEQEGIPLEHQFSDAFLARVGQEVAARVPSASQGQIDLAFVSDAEIQRLNRMYRQKDKVTDVLSFGMPDGHITGMLGDVLISYPQAVRQAEGDIELELVDLLVHGVLHVLGYDHEEPQDAARMFPLQDAIVAACL